MNVPDPTFQENEVSLCQRTVVACFILLLSQSSALGGENPDPYEVLEVERDATPEEIHKAFRKKSWQYHPDSNVGTPDESKFKEVQNAYDLLRDAKSRAKYDKYTAEPTNHKKRSRKQREAPSNPVDDAFQEVDAARSPSTGHPAGMHVGIQVQVLFPYLNSFFGDEPTLQTKPMTGGLYFGDPSLPPALRDPDGDVFLRFPITPSMFDRRVDPETGQNLDQAPKTIRLPRTKIQPAIHAMMEGFVDIKDAQGRNKNRFVNILEVDLSKDPKNPSAYVGYRDLGDYERIANAEEVRVHPVANSDFVTPPPNFDEKQGQRRFKILDPVWDDNRLNMPGWRRIQVAAVDSKGNQVPISGGKLSFSDDYREREMVSGFGTLVRSATHAYAISKEGGDTYVLGDVEETAQGTFLKLHPSLQYRPQRKGLMNKKDFSEATFAAVDEKGKLVPWLNLDVLASRTRLSDVSQASRWRNNANLPGTSVEDALIQHMALAGNSVVNFGDRIFPSRALRAARIARLKDPRVPEVLGGMLSDLVDFDHHLYDETDRHVEDLLFHNMSPVSPRAAKQLAKYLDWSLSRPPQEADRKLLTEEQLAILKAFPGDSLSKGLSARLDAHDRELDLWEKKKISSEVRTRIARLREGTEAVRAAWKAKKNLPILERGRGSQDGCGPSFSAVAHK